MEIGSCGKFFCVKVQTTNHLLVITVHFNFQILKAVTVLRNSSIIEKNNYRIRFLESWLTMMTLMQTITSLYSSDNTALLLPRIVFIFPIIMSGIVFTRLKYDFRAKQRVSSSLIGWGSSLYDIFTTLGSEYRAKQNGRAPTGAQVLNTRNKCVDYRFLCCSAQKIILLFILKQDQATYQSGGNYHLLYSTVLMHFIINFHALDHFVQ